MRFYDVAECPRCHGTAETPTHHPCPRCEAFGYVEICLAERPGQRYEHDQRVCSHYRNVGRSPL
jgi:RecJ-like exonuclease